MTSISASPRSASGKPLLSDPYLFSYVIMVLYACNILRQAYAGNWQQVWYWFAALNITMSITFTGGKK